MPPFVPISRFSTSRGHAPWRVRRREAIAAPPSVVWSALTEPGGLKGWWCDEAEVDLREGGVFHCRGTTLYGDGRDCAPGLVLRVEPPSILEVTWPLHGVETRVVFELENHLEETRLTVEQSAATPPGWDPGQRANWWWIALPALRMLIETGQPALRLDYRQAASGPPFEAAVSVTTFPWVVWHKLTSPIEASRWWHRTDALETEPPGAFRWRDSERGPRKVIEARRESLLLHDFVFEDGSEGRVMWSLEETDQDVVVRLLDVGPWPSAEPPVAIAIERAAWLLQLKRFSERGIAPDDALAP